jgi:hypothetical protein
MKYKQLAASVLVVGSAAIGISPAAQAASLIRSVALSGQQAPGLSPGDIFVTFTAPTLNNSGRVAFGAAARAFEPGAPSGIWTDRTGTLELFVQGGGEAPGSAPAVYFTARPHINNAGEIAFDAALAGPGVTQLNNFGLWSDASGTITKIARTGDAAPDTSMGTFSCSNPSTGFDGGQQFCSTRTMDEPLFNDAGQALVASEVYDNSLPPSPFPRPQEKGLWSNRSGTLRKIVALGDAAPGTGGEFTMFTDEFISRFAAFNNTGDIAFSSFVSSGGAGVWVSRNSSGGNPVLSFVAGPGSSTGGILPGVTFGFSRLAGFNDDGQIGIETALQGAGVASQNDTSLWLSSNGELHLIAREGQSIPGTGLTFRQGLFNFVSTSMNRNGTFVFSADVGSVSTGGSKYGIFTADENGIYVEALGGEHAPGTPPGVVFDNFIGSTGNVAINGVGQVAFFANLKGPGVSSLNDKGIWATDRAGVLRLIVRTGDTIEYSPGQFGTVSDFVSYLSSGDQDGRKASFNDQGQIAFDATGTGFRWGIFISDAATVPEPPAIVLAMIGFLGVLRRCKH